MQIRQRGKDGKASKQPGISRNTQPDRRSKEGTERTSSIWEGCRANPRAVSMAVLDTGRPLYLCMGKSNRRESGGNEIRERRRYDSGVKGEEAGLYKKAGTLAKKGGRSVETAYRESPLELLLSERAYRLLYKMVMGILAFSVIVKTCSDICFTIGQKNCQMFVAKLHKFHHPHNRMRFYPAHSVLSFPDFAVDTFLPQRFLR